MKLEGCKSLTEVPNFSGMFPRLKSISLCCCTSLVELHPSLGSLEKLVDINLKGCHKLTMFPSIDNATSLRSIDLSLCYRLKHFPEIKEKVESLTELHLCNTDIKELPSSIDNLISLKKLYLGRCRRLAQIPQSIYNLQKLQNFWFAHCPKLVTFPNTMNLLPTNPNVPDDEYGSIPESDDEVCLRLPKLRLFNAAGCNLWETDFLFVRLELLELVGCKRLREIPELPPSMRILDATDCVSLERIANISNILEQKESNMPVIRMNLTNCRKLCDTLAQDVETMKRRLLINEATLFSLCLSHMQSPFQVVFAASDVPEWFRCQMEFTEGFPFYEFSMEILPHLPLEKTGLVISIAVEKAESSSHHHSYECSFQISFSSDHSLGRGGFAWKIDTRESSHAFMYYYPFTELQPLIDIIPLPFTFQVTIESPLTDSYIRGRRRIKSCGVHLVMPPNEDVSI
ncbi:hypothetical protein ACLB2K_046914 [Fragaria x ananassa]